MYISTKEFAQAAGLDRKSAARICKEAHLFNKRWFGCQLNVKVESGTRGGNGGQRYLVSVASLPDLFRNMLPCEGSAEGATTVPSGKPPSRLDHARILEGGDRRSRVISERYGTIRHALEARPGSEERRVRIAAAAAQAYVSEATIYRWLSDYAASGLSGLAPQPRQQRPAPMVVSRKFDRLFREQNSDPEDKLKLIGEELDLLIKTMWTTKTSQAGMTAMAEDIGFLLENYCQSCGFNVDGIDCQPSISKVRAHRSYSLAYTFLNHAEKRQGILPRIRRTYVDVAPMDIVFVDVKLCDLFIMEGGKRYRPALIGFLDAGTGRLFAHMVKLAKGTAVTKAQVFEGLAQLVTHPNWGVPRAIYTDNGSEMIGLIEGMAALAKLGQACPIIRAKEYNPQAKPIEGLFGNLNRRVFSKLEGFTGGKRKKLRIHPAQKAAAPYSRTWEELCGDLQTLLQDYHAFRRQSRLSPDEIFQRKLSTIGRSLDILSEEDAVSLFGHLTSRVVRQGSFTVDGARYTDPSIYAKHGRRIDVVVSPLPHAVSALDGKIRCEESIQEAQSLVAGAQEQPTSHCAPYLTDNSGRLYPAVAERSYGPLERQGAEESEKRQEETWQEVRRILNEVDRCSLPPSVAIAAARNFKRLREGAPPSSGGVSAHGRIDFAQQRALRRADEQQRLDRVLLEKRL